MSREEEITAIITMLDEEIAMTESLLAQSCVISRYELLQGLKLANQSKELWQKMLGRKTRRRVIITRQKRAFKKGSRASTKCSTNF